MNPGRACGERVEVDGRHERLRLGVDLEDRAAPRPVGPVDDDGAVEAARAQQRGVEHVRAVRGRDDDDRVLRLEAVHLDEQLVERLLPLVVAAAQPGAAVTPDGVDLVDEDDRRRDGLRLVEEVPNARGADAHEHLDELGAGDGEEGGTRFACDGSREERLAVPGGPASSTPFGMRAPRRGTSRAGPETP